MLHVIHKYNFLLIEEIERTLCRDIATADQVGGVAGVVGVDFVAVEDVWADKDVVDVTEEASEELVVADGVWAWREGDLTGSGFRVNSDVVDPQGGLGTIVNDAHLVEAVGVDRVGGSSELRLTSWVAETDLVGDGVAVLGSHDDVEVRASNVLVVRQETASGAGAVSTAEEEAPRSSGSQINRLETGNFEPTTVGLERSTGSGSAGDGVDADISNWGSDKLVDRMILLVSREWQPQPALPVVSGNWLVGAFDVAAAGGQIEVGSWSARLNGDNSIWIDDFESSWIASDWLEVVTERVDASTLDLLWCNGGWGRTLASVSAGGAEDFLRDAAAVCLAVGSS